MLFGFGGSLEEVLLVLLIVVVRVLLVDFEGGES